VQAPGATSQHTVQQDDNHTAPETRTSACALYVQMKSVVIPCADAAQSSQDNNSGQRGLFCQQNKPTGQHGRTCHTCTCTMPTGQHATTCHTCACTCTNIQLRSARSALCRCPAQLSDEIWYRRHSCLPKPNMQHQAVTTHVGNGGANCRLTIRTCCCSLQPRQVQGLDNTHSCQHKSLQPVLLAPKHLTNFRQLKSTA
jgi:hypothetical protein